MFSRIIDYFNPKPEFQNKQGFEPNLYIKLLRGLARLLIAALRLHGRGRFSNEFIQQLDPKIEVSLPDGGTLAFRTGHGRLQWRAEALLTEEPMMIRWIDTFRPDDVFFDVGANVGNYTLYAAHRGVKTVGFEPELFNAQLMYENAHINGLLGRITVVPLAVGENTRKDVFYLKSVSKGDALHSVGRPSYMLTDHESLITADVLVISLDDAVARFGLPRPTRLKIDVDNNELNVVEGATEVLKTVNEVYIELDLREEEHREVKTRLEASGFVVAEQENIPRLWNAVISNYLFRRS